MSPWINEGLHWSTVNKRETCWMITSLPMRSMFFWTRGTHCLRTANSSGMVVLGSSRTSLHWGSLGSKKENSGGGREDKKRNGLISATATWKLHLYRLMKTACLQHWSANINILKRIKSVILWNVLAVLAEANEIRRDIHWHVMNQMKHSRTTLEAESEEVLPSTHLSNLS